MGFKKIIILVLFCVTLGHAIFHLVNVVMSGETLLLQWLPDDTFYYLNIAKHFSTRGVWTFDGGQTITTGFHPLWAYLLVPIIYVVGDDPMLLMQTVACLSFVIAMGSVLTVAVTFFKAGMELPVLVLAVFLSAISFLANSISGMEWSLAFAISIFYYRCLAYCTDNDTQLKQVVIFLLGAVGSVSRSEFGALAFAGFSAAIFIRLFARQPNYLLPSGVGLAGAIVGLCLVFFHNAYFSGEWLQSSSQIKFFWSEAFGHSPVPILLQMARILFYVPVLRLDMQSALQWVDYANSLLVVIGFILSVSAVIFIRHQMSLFSSWLKTDQQTAFLTIAAGLSVCFYLFTYTFNAFASQIWYTVFLTVPLFILVTFGLEWLSRYWASPIIVGVLAMLIIINLTVFHLSPPIYQGQELGKAIGLTVKQITGARVGISDAGIVNFYQGGTVINTDGLVNNEIKTYLYNGRLECYLLDKHIQYTTGFGSSEQASARRGAPIDWTTFSEGQWFAHDTLQISLHKVDFSKLATLPKCQR